MSFDVRNQTLMRSLKAAGHSVESWNTSTSTESLAELQETCALLDISRGDSSCRCFPVSRPEDFMGGTAVGCGLAP